jgi:hypothetical protein
MFLVHPNSMMVIQARIDKGKETAKWAVTEKICGYRATKFNIRIDKNISRICNCVPFSDLLRV